MQMTTAEGQWKTLCKTQRIGQTITPTIDDFRIYSGLLSDAQVAALHGPAKKALAFQNAVLGQIASQP